MLSFDWTHFLGGILKLAALSRNFFFYAFMYFVIFTHIIILHA